MLQKYRLYLKRMSGLHTGANGRKGGGKGASLPHDANFQACALEPPVLKVCKRGRVAEQDLLCAGGAEHCVLHLPHVLAHVHLVCQLCLIPAATNGTVGTRGVYF